MRYMNRFFLLFVLIVLSSCASDENRFVLRDDVGITFENTLYYTEDFNPYTYRNFFNGAGVALGDINNDGLIDIYFTGNLVGNELYLNKGNWQFENITDLAGVACEGNWSAGATFVDINDDGLLDLYVSKSGKPGGERRYNELFINNGDLTFTESAAAYGLDITGLSVQAAFFDYDGDGDLDAYLLNNSIRSVGAYDLIEDQRLIASDEGNQLLENRDGYFVPVSSEKGVFSSAIGFGLGITLSDFNGDFWPDLFISNDYFEKDYLYLNDSGKGFIESSDQYFDALSMGSMGADAADLDNDLQPDIMVTEMLPESLERQKSKQVFESWDKFELAVSKGYHKQYSRNVLQRNLSGKFYEVGRQLGVSATEWSWAALMFDMDNDGYRDIYVSNGIFKDLLDRDYLTYNANEESLRQQLQKGEEAITALIDLMPSSAVPNAVYRNRGDFTFEDVRTDWGLNLPSFSNGSAYGDLDNDGDLDLVVSNIDEAPFVFENRSEKDLNQFLTIQLEGPAKNRFAIGAKVLVHLSDGRSMMAEQFPSRGFQSSVPNRLHFGLGQKATIDSVEVYWPNRQKSVHPRVAVNQFLKLSYNPSQSSPIDLEGSRIEGSSEGKIDPITFDYEHSENRYIDFDSERMLPQSFSNEGPALTSADINNDGYSDYFLGGAKGQSGVLFLSKGSAGFERITEPFEAHLGSEDVEAPFFDANGDGLLDLYVASGGKAFSSVSTDLKDRLYVQTASGSFAWSSNALSEVTAFSTGALAVADIDLDGDFDVFIGARFDTRTYGKSGGGGQLLVNDGSGVFRSVQPDGFDQLGMLTTAGFADVNGDNRPDLIVAGEWMPVTIFYNAEKGWQQAQDLALEQTVGMWRGLSIADINGDNIPDFILGNAGLNGFYREGMRLYINDFDANGRLEQLYAVPVGNEYFPVHDKDELIKQLPGLKKKLLYYSDYAKAGIESIFGPELLSSAASFELDQVESSVFLSSPNGYTRVALADELQYSSIYTTAIDPAKHDSRLRVFLGGNQYDFKPQYGAYDASTGWELEIETQGDDVMQRVRPLGIDGALRKLTVTYRGPRKDSLILIAARNNKSIRSLYVKNE